MFSKGKSGAKLLENNLILHHFDVGRLYASGGPEGVWKIYEGFSKNDGKVSTVYSVYRHGNPNPYPVKGGSNMFLPPPPLFDRGLL